MTDRKLWWKDYPWRLVQTNIPETDMADMDAEAYVDELKKFNANAVIINTGGIVANYDTRFPFHNKNPYLTGDNLKKVFEVCRREGIRVISRVDFSKVRKPIYEHHPDWAYVSPKGNIIDYHGDIHVCFNSEYQQEHAFEIMREIITELDPDGLFMNMAGYFVAFDYDYNWHGICQCDNCRRRFFEMYGENIPTIEDPDDPLYQKYLEFQVKTTAEYYNRIKELITETKPDLLFFHTDMQRHEAGTFMGNASHNYFYKASELLKLEKYSQPEKIASVTSVDFIDMMYRYAAVWPQQQELRIAQTLANGGYADLYMAGRADKHPDKSGFKPLQRIFRYHKNHEEEYRNIVSNAKIVLIKPSLDRLFDFLTMSNLDEYLGWYFLLSQRHYVFDCMESTAIPRAKLDKYDTVILPNARKLPDETMRLLDEFARKGNTVIATGETAQLDSRGRKLPNVGLDLLGIKRIGFVSRENVSAYFKFEDKTGFKRFEDNDYVYLHGTYCYAEYMDDVKQYMKLIPPHRHSPAESAYYTNITNYPAVTVNKYGEGRGVYIPWLPGKEYFMFGFPHMHNFMADVLEGVLGIEPVGGNLPEAVEVTYTRRGDINYVHLVNGTGYFCNSFFDPVELRDLYVELPAPAKSPDSVASMVTGKPCNYELNGDKIKINVDRLGLFEAIKIS